MDNNTTTRYVEIGTPPVFPPEYRIIATVLHAIIFVFGVVGNVLVVIVVLRKKNMHIPTYCYLVSLAVADVLVIVSSLPEAIVSYHLYANQWVLGQAGCSLMAVSSNLGINASSLSILAFTVERYIAICHPLRAKRLCTLQRAKKIIVGLWVVAGISAVPWFGLTVVRQHPRYTEMEICTFRVSPDKYFYLFGSDLFLFYLVPLVTATILYCKIGLALRKSSRSDSVLAKSVRHHHSNGSTRSKTSVRLENGSPVSRLESDYRSGYYGTEPPQYGGPYDTGSNMAVAGEVARKSMDRSLRQSRIKVIRMLLVIVILFAVLWLPYRGISLYNGFASLVGTPTIYNKWLMLFAKTCIFLNSSINPILYNALSKRFRQAFRDILFCSEASEKSSSSAIDACHSSKSLLSRGISPSPSPSYNSKEHWNGHHNFPRSSYTCTADGQVLIDCSTPLKRRKGSVVFLEPLVMNGNSLRSISCSSSLQRRSQ